MGEYDDLGNKKKGNKQQEVDKGPRECKGIKIVDTATTKYKCKSRKPDQKNRHLSKRCGSMRKIKELQRYQEGLLQPRHRLGSPQVRHTSHHWYMQLNANVKFINEELMMEIKSSSGDSINFICLLKK